jgi:YD repeat-containing protein
MVASDFAAERHNAGQTRMLGLQPKLGNRLAWLVVACAAIWAGPLFGQSGGPGFGGGGGGPSGQKFDNLSMSFNPSTYVLTVSYDGAGVDPSPAPWAELRQGATGLDFYRSNTDMNNVTISTAAGSHTYNFQLPNATGSFSLLILYNWITPGAFNPPDPDPQFYVAFFSIDGNGNVNISNPGGDLIGYTGIFAVQTSRPCDQGSDPSCARFPGACPVQQCDIQQHQDMIRFLDAGSLQGIYGLTQVGAAGCSSCGTGGTELGSALPTFSFASSSCSGGRVPPGAPPKNCQPGTQAGMVDIGLVLREEFGVFPSSFGLGGFMGAYDGFVQRFDLADGTTKLRYFDPAYGQVYTMDYDAQANKFHDPQNRVREAAVVNNKWRIIYHDGAWVEFEYFDVGSQQSDGFITKVGDALDRFVTIARDGDGKITSIFDEVGNTAQISYQSGLVGGRPAISQINISSDSAPQTLTFAYANNHLSQITFNGTTVWTGSLTVNASAQTAQLEIYNAFVGKRKYNYTQDYILLYGTLHAQPTMLIRNILNSNNESLVALFVNPTDSHHRLELIGTSILKRYQTEIGPSSGSVSMRYATNFTVGNIADGWNAITVIGEEQAASQTRCIYPGVVEAEIQGDIRMGTAAEVQDAHGVLVQLEYDSDGFLTKRTYAPNDYEQFTLNVNKKITQHRRRDGVIVNYTYLNNTLVQSITQDNTVREFVYWTGGVKKYLLKESRDPLYNSTNPTMHCTTLDYTTDRGLLMQVLGPAATPSGTRPETTYTYTGRRQRETTTVKRAIGNDVVEEYVYDSLGRITQINYLSDGTNRQISYINSPNNPFTSNTTYGVDHCTLNTPVLIKDRTNRVQCRLQNHFKNAISYAFYGSSTDVFAAGNMTVNSNVNLNTITTNTYYAGTELPLATTTNGNRQSFEYDYRGRRNKVTQNVASGKTLVSHTTYGGNNRLLSTTDPYGRKTWYGRSLSSGQLLRTIQEFVPNGIGLSDNASVLNATRSAANNAKYAISDSNYDVVGRLVETIDPMGMVTKFEYNNRDQRTKQTVAFGTGLASVTESFFDLAGNVTEVRHPRYFDATDSDGHQKDRTTYTYDGANRNISVSRAPGTSLAATSQTLYYWDGRVHKTIDPLNNETERLYVGCCDRTQVSKNSLGHGSISNADPEGRSYHSAFVADVAGHANYYDPTNASTFQESTTVYDGLGRAYRNTRWNVPQAQIDWDSVPAAGLNGVAASAGVTSQTFYDVNLTDSVGLNTAGGVAVTIPNTGASFNVNLTAAISKLASPPASGGASTSFTTHSVGSATVSVNHDASSVTFQISDGAGRTVMSGQLNGPAHASPSGLLDWQCMTYDTTVSIAGYGTVQEIQSIDQANQISKTRTDAGGRTLESYDTLNKRSWAEYDPAGNL